MQPETLTPKPSVGSEHPLSIELDRAPQASPGSGKTAAGIRFSLGIGGLFAAYFTAFLVAWAVVPSVVPGWRSVVISSGSMAPVIQTGDVVVATPSDGQGLSPGTVVVISDPALSGPVTHRIISVNPDGSYQTMGDANTVVDSTPVMPEHVVAVGRLLVPYVGLPLVWYWSGAWGILAVWGFFVVFSLWAARFAYQPLRQRGWHDDGAG